MREPDIVFEEALGSGGDGAAVLSVRVQARRRGGGNGPGARAERLAGSRTKAQQREGAIPADPGEGRLKLSGSLRPALAVSCMASRSAG